MRWTRAYSCLNSLILTGCSLGVTSSSASSCGDVSLAVPAGDGGPVASESYATSELVASFSAQAYGDGVRVYTSLDGPLGARVTLGPHDLLTASDDGGLPVALTLEPETTGSELHYVTTFPQNDGPADVVIALTRSTTDSAPRSEVVVAPSFAITSVPPAAVLVGDRLPVAVSPAPVPLAGVAGDAWTIMASGACITDPLPLPIVVDVDAQGNASFDTSVLRGALSGADPAPCDVTLQVRHETAGFLDPAFMQSNGVPDAAVTLGQGPAISPLYGAAFQGLQARSFVVHLLLEAPEAGATDETDAGATDGAKPIDASVSDAATD